MRLFFAADVDDATNVRVNEFIRGLKRLDPSVGWVRPENHHITVYFFGEADEEVETSIERILTDAARGVRPFTLKVRGVSAFPAVDRPRVIWVGIENAGGELARMHEAVGESIRREKLPVNVEDRKYTPHLTVGRVKQRCSASLVAELKRHGETAFGEVRVGSTVLYRSVLAREGALYTPLKTIAMS
jgi:2'-5' RNA ligase